MTEPVRKHAPGTDAIAAARELEELAEAEAAGLVDSPPLVRASTANSEVFSVRLPESAAALLRERAKAQGISPGLLLRALALESLTGDSGAGALTYKQAEELFQRTLANAAIHTLATWTVGAGETGLVEKEPAGGLNLGPRRQFQKLSERRS